MLGSRRPPYARLNQCRRVLYIRTHTPMSCRRPGPAGIDETTMLVSLATGAVEKLVRLIFLVPAVAPVVPVAPVVEVLSAEAKSVLIDTGVTVA